MLVLPTRDIRENERDYAVAFAIPIDTKGVIHICRPPGVPREPRKIERPLSSKFGHVECLVIFDDVFVPWERVFMCGEWDLAAPMVLNFANIHRTTKCGCKAGQIDLMIGTAALMAEYNDVERAAHIQYKLTEMILAAEIAFASGVTAAVQGNKHPSGVFIPSAIHSNVGKFYASSKLGEDYLFLQDIGGGPVVTLPAEKDFFNPETGKWMEKYLKGKEGVPTEHRIRVLKLIEDFTASEFGGWLMGLSTNAAGAPMAERIEILRQYDMRKRKEIAKAIAGIA
jgi:aromatic ring hydroxylase